MFCIGPVNRFISLIKTLRYSMEIGTGDGSRTRKLDVIAPTDFKSVFCANSNTPAYGGSARFRTEDRPVMSQML